MKVYSSAHSCVSTRALKGTIEVSNPTNTYIYLNACCVYLHLAHRLSSYLGQLDMHITDPISLMIFFQVLKTLIASWNLTNHVHFSCYSWEYRNFVSSIFILYHLSKQENKSSNMSPMNSYRSIPSKLLKVSFG